MDPLSETNKAPVRGSIALKKTTGHGEDWTSQIKELESFFNSVVLPVGPVRLDSATTITNVPEFIVSHLQTIKHNNGNRLFQVYLKRTYLLKGLIETRIFQGSFL